MKSDYLDFYNNLVRLTTNKSLYDGFINKQDSFGDRLNLFLIHFAFVLKEFKSSENEKKLQDLYDFNFRQLELSIREIGYGDQSINKKMKDYVNLFHSIIIKIEKWKSLNLKDKNQIIKSLFNGVNNDDLGVYFDKFCVELENNTLNYYIKSVIKPKK